MSETEIQVGPYTLILQHIEAGEDLDECVQMLVKFSGETTLAGLRCPDYKEWEVHFIDQWLMKDERACLALQAMNTGEVRPLLDRIQELGISRHPEYHTAALADLARASINSL